MDLSRLSWNAIGPSLGPRVRQGVERLEAGLKRLEARLGRLEVRLERLGPFRGLPRGLLGQQRAVWFGLALGLAVLATSALLSPAPVGGPCGLWFEYEHTLLARPWTPALGTYVESGSGASVVRFELGAIAVQLLLRLLGYGTLGLALAAWLWRQSAPAGDAGRAEGDRFGIGGRPRRSSEPRWNATRSSDSQPARRPALVRGAALWALLALPLELATGVLLAGACAGWKLALLPALGLALLRDMGLAVAALVASSWLWRHHKLATQARTWTEHPADRRLLALAGLLAALTILLGLRLAPPTGPVLLMGLMLASGSALAFGAWGPPTRARTAPPPVLFPPSRLDMAPIPAGSFLMGSSILERGRLPNEGPRRRVQVAAFFMARTVVTRSEYRAAMGSSPREWSENSDEDGELPATGLSWFDSVRFCNRLSELDGLDAVYRRGDSETVEYGATEEITRFEGANGYRLPSEAEWEYACRARTTTRFSSGDSDADLAQVGWFDQNSGDEVHPVKEKSPNAWGLFDMHGNVWEWCEDEWFDGYRGAPLDAQPRGAGTDPLAGRVFRGGGFSDGADGCRSAGRDRFFPRGRGDDIGFRVVRAPSP